MTPRQQDIYLVIEMWWQKYGYSPSIDEIMMVSKDKSRSNVSRLINELCKIGACKKIPNKRRTLRPSGIRFKNLNELLDD